jgi:F-type H+-transporting ATPase subunit b
MKQTRWIILAALIAPVWLFGSENAEALAQQYFAVAGRMSDFVPRIFNFTIFAGLAYYLVASPIKNFFVGRKEGIADELEAIERKVNEAKEARKASEQKVEESKAKAAEIREDSAREIELLKAKFAEMTDKELALLDKHDEEKREMEERRMARETIEALLAENITADDIPMGAEQVINVVAKKVA